MRELIKNKTLRESLALLALGLALGAYSLIGFRTAAVQTKWALSPYLFPLLLSVLALILAAALFAEGRRERAAGEAPAAAAPRAKKTVWIVLAAAIFYDALLPLIRFIPATALFLAALTWLLGERRRWMIAAVALVTPLLLYALFGLALGLRLP